MTRQISWSFTGDEFAHVWEAETGRDEVPFPLSILETTTTETEHAMLASAVSARYPRGGDRDLSDGLRAVANPELRIVSWGRFHHGDTRLRTLAAAVADMGVIVFQHPATADFGGDVKMVVMHRRQLGQHLAATLPPAPAGTAGRMQGCTPRVRGQEPITSWRTDASGQRPVDERIRRLLWTPRAAEGYLCFDREPYSTRPHRSLYTNWIDVRPDAPGAGRYLLDVTDTETVVTPASAETLATAFARHAGQ